MHHFSHLAECSSISCVYRFASELCILMAEKVRAGTGFLQVWRSSECQADKCTGWPDRSPFFMSQPCLPPLEPLSISPGHCRATADYIGHPPVSVGTWPSGWNDTGWWQADPMQASSNTTPIHTSGSHDTLSDSVLWSGLFCGNQSVHSSPFFHTHCVLLIFFPTLTKCRLRKKRTPQSWVSAVGFVNWRTTSKYWSKTCKMSYVLFFFCCGRQFDLFCLWD